MQIDRKATPVFMRIFCLAFAAITLICTALFFISDSWIPLAVMYGCVAVLALLAALDRIIYHKEKFIGAIFIFMVLAFFLNLIVTLIRNVNI